MSWQNAEALLKLLQAQESQIGHLKSVVLESNPHAKPLPSIVDRTYTEKSSPRRSSIDQSAELSSASSFVKKPKAPAISSGLPSGVLELRLMLARRLIKVLLAQQNTAADGDMELSICLRQLVIGPPPDARSPVKVEERQSQFFRTVKMKVNRDADEVYIAFSQAFLIQPPAEFHVFVIEFVSPSMNTVAWACVPTEKMGERVVQLREPPLEPFRVLSEPELRVIPGTCAIFDICRPFKPKKSLEELAAMQPGQMQLTKEDEILWRAQPPPKKFDPSFASRWANQRVAENNSAYAPLPPQRRPSASQRQAVDRWLTRWGDDAETLLAPKPPPSDAGSNSARRLSSLVPSMVQRVQESLAAKLAKEEEARRELERQIREEAEKRAAMTARFAEQRRRRSSAVGDDDSNKNSASRERREAADGSSGANSAQRRQSFVPSMVERQAQADKLKKEREEKERREREAEEEEKRRQAIRRGSLVPAMVERYESKEEARRAQEEREKEQERQRKLDEARRIREQAAARRASHSLPADDATLIVPTMVLQREAKEAAEKQRAEQEAQAAAERKRQEARDRAERKRREEEETRRREEAEQAKRAQEQQQREQRMKEEQQRLQEAEERKNERLRRDEERRVREEEEKRRLEELRQQEAEEAAAKRAERQRLDAERRQREQEEYDQKLKEESLAATKERRRSSVVVGEASPPPDRRRASVADQPPNPPPQDGNGTERRKSGISVEPATPLHSSDDAPLGGYRDNSFAKGSPHGSVSPASSGGQMRASGGGSSRRMSSIKFVGIADFEMVESQVLESIDGSESLDDSQFREDYPPVKRASIIPGTRPSRGFNSPQEKQINAATANLQIDGLLGLPLDTTVARVLLYFCGLVDPETGSVVGDHVTNPQLLSKPPAIVLYPDMGSWGAEPNFTHQVDLVEYVGKTSLAVAVIEVASEDDGCYTYGFCVLPIFDQFKPGAYKTRLLPGDPRPDAPYFANRRIPTLTKRPMAAEEYCPIGFIKWRKNTPLDSVSSYKEEAGQPALSDEEKLILKDRMSYGPRRAPASLGIETVRDAEKQFLAHMHPGIATVRALTLSKYNPDRTVVLNIESIVQALSAEGEDDPSTTVKYVACRVDVHMPGEAETYSFDVIDQDYAVSHGIPIFIDKPLEFSCGPGDVRTTAVLKIFKVSVSVANSSAAVSVEPFGWSAVDLFTVDGSINQGRFAVPLFVGLPDDELHVKPLLAEPCRDAISNMQKAGDVELVPRTTFVTFSIADAVRAKDALLRNAFFSYTKTMYHKDSEGRDHMREVQERMRELARRQSSSGVTLEAELKDVLAPADLRRLVETQMDQMP